MGRVGIDAARGAMRFGSSNAAPGQFLEAAFGEFVDRLLARKFGEVFC